MAINASEVGSNFVLHLLSDRKTKLYPKYKPPTEKKAFKFYANETLLNIPKIVIWNSNK